MIRKDEQGPTRGRRRFYDAYATYHDTTGKLTYPAGELDPIRRSLGQIQLTTSSRQYHGWPVGPYAIRAA